MKDLFLKKCREVFKDRYDDFVKEIDKPVTHGFFLNTKKAKKEEILEMINFDAHKSSFTDNSYSHNYESIGKSIPYELGLIYPQGIEATVPASLPDTEYAKIVLDMCAAPGGKTINIANRVLDNTIIISNEYNFKRVQALLSNIERMGLSNIIVTNKDGKTLAKELYKSVDIVLVDAPCSGEGMIRKYPELINDYNEKNIQNLVSIQEELLENAYNCLKPNGQIVYSTCTFNLDEDENQVRKLINKYHDLSLEYEKKYSFIDGSEGQYMAHIRRNANDVTYTPKLKKIVKNKTIENFINDNLNIDNYYLYQIKDNYYLSLIELPDLNSNVLRYGIFLGTIEKDRFIPEHHLYRSNVLSDRFKNVYELNDEEYEKYIKGIQLKADIKDGFYLIKYKGYSLGFVKASKGLLNNKYPKGLRRA